jgi:hypothetical protein
MITGPVSKPSGPIFYRNYLDKLQKDIFLPGKNESIPDEQASKRT